MENLKSAEFFAIQYEEDYREVGIDNLIQGAVAAYSWNEAVAFAQEIARESNNRKTEIYADTSTGWRHVMVLCSGCERDPQ